jgi:hypothetical protein
MGVRNPPEKQRGYASAYREKKRAEGLKQLVVWVRPEDAERVRAYARKLASSGTYDPDRALTNDEIEVFSGRRLRNAADKP